MFSVSPCEATLGHSCVPATLGNQADRVSIVLSPERPDVSPLKQQGVKWTFPRGWNPGVRALVPRLMMHTPRVSVGLQKLLPRVSS